MNRIGSDEPLVEPASNVRRAPTRPTWPRTLFSAVLPPVAAFGIQAMLSAYVPRWTLLYPAVFLSAWLGGFGSGVTAPIMSAAVLWLYLTPPAGSFVKSDPRYLVATAVFILMGILLSAMQGRLRRLNRE